MAPKKISLAAVAAFDDNASVLEAPVFAPRPKKSERAPDAAHHRDVSKHHKSTVSKLSAASTKETAIYSASSGCSEMGQGKICFYHESIRLN